MTFFFSRKSRGELRKEIRQLTVEKTRLEDERQKLRQLADHNHAIATASENRRSQLKKQLDNIVMDIPPLLATPDMLVTLPKPAHDEDDPYLLDLLQTGRADHLSTTSIDMLLGISREVRESLKKHKFPDFLEFFKRCPTTFRQKCDLPKGLLDYAPGFETVRRYPDGTQFRERPTSGEDYCALLAHADYLLDVFKPTREDHSTRHWLYISDLSTSPQELLYPTYTEWQSWLKLGAPAEGVSLKAYTQAVRQTGKVSSDRAKLLPSSTPQLLIENTPSVAVENWHHKLLQLAKDPSGKT